MTRIATHALELRLHQRERALVARTESELLVEPPLSGLEAFLVAVATELVRIDSEVVRAEQRVRHREHATVDRAGLATAKRVEHVVGDLGTAEESAREHVAHRHSVVQREERIDGLEHESPLRLHAEGDELEPVAAVDAPHIARIGVHECVEVALARDHRVLGELDIALGLRKRARADRTRLRAHRCADVGATALERARAEVRACHRERLARARGRVVRPGELQLESEFLVESVPRPVIGPEPRQPLHEKLGLALVRSLEPRNPLAQRHVPLVETRALRVAREERQSPLEPRRIAERFPAHAQARAKPLYEPLRRRCKKRIADGSSSDAGVRELAAPAPQVRAPIEAREQPLGSRCDRRSVGVGKQDQRRLVQALHRASLAKMRLFQQRKQAQLLSRGLRAEFEPEPLELRECGPRASGARRFRRPRGAAPGHGCEPSSRDARSPRAQFSRWWRARPASLDSCAGSYPTSPPHRSRAPRALESPR